MLIFFDVLDLCSLSFIMSNFGSRSLFTQKDGYVIFDAFSSRLYCRSRIKEVKWSFKSNFRYEKSTDRLLYRMFDAFCKSGKHFIS